MAVEPLNLRARILDLAREFAAERDPGRFVPGETYIPVSGKVLDDEDLVNLIEASLDMHLTAGRFAKEFESALAAKFGVARSSLTVSGSAANLLAFSALTSRKLRQRRITPGSEIITVAAGFPTTIAPIIQNGCIPVFVDIEPETYNAAADQLADAVGPKTRAIMLAHTMGNPFDLDVVTKLARDNDLFLIEDCCDAFGATYGDKSVGTFGDLATLSFYPAHHITMGEGGAVLTNRNLFGRLVDSYRDWGRDCWCEPGKANTCGKRWDWKFGSLPQGYDHKYVYAHIGYNLKVTDIQAAIGCSQLRKVDAFIERRRKNFAMLDGLLRREGMEEFFEFPKATADSNPSWFGYLLTRKDSAPFERADAIRYLEDRHIGTRPLFAGNILRQPGFREIEHRVVGELTCTDKVMRDCFWIGVWPGIGEAQLAYMVETFRDMIKALTK